MTMLRAAGAAFGSFAGATFGSLAGGIMARRNGNIMRTIVGQRIWTNGASSRLSAVPWHQRALMSQLRTIRPAGGRPRLALTRVPLPNPRRPFHSTRSQRADPSQKRGEAVPEEPLSLSARLKKLSREYGWSAVGVYLALSVLDFPFCFLLVRTVGTEKIAYAEDLVIRNVQRLIPERVQNWWREYRQAAKELRRQRTGGVDEVEVVGHGVAEAEQRSRQEGASLATQLALAYAIHKSFIFVRVPLTAAITPKVVRILRSWGWQIGTKAKR